MARQPGDVTAHAEIEMLRKAATVLNVYAPSVLAVLALVFALITTSC